MYVATTFTAKFTENEEVALTYEAETGGSVTPKGENVRPASGKPVGSTASVNAGYTFDGWYVGTKKVSEELVLSKAVIDQNAKDSKGLYVATTFTAKFTENAEVALTYEAETGGSVTPNTVFNFG